MGKSREWLPFSSAWRTKYKEKLRNPDMTDAELLDREVKYRRTMVQTSISAGFYIGGHIALAAASCGGNIPVALIQLSWQAFVAMQANFKHKLVIEEIYRRGLVPRKMTKAEMAKTALWATASVALAQIIDGIALSSIGSEAGTHVMHAFSGSETFAGGMQSAWDTIAANPGEAASELAAQGGSAALTFMLDGLAAGGVVTAGLFVASNAGKVANSRWLASATNTLTGGGAMRRQGSHSAKSTALMGNVRCNDCGKRFTTRMTTDMQRTCNECQMARHYKERQEKQKRIDSFETCETDSDDPRCLATLHLDSFCDGCLDAIVGTRYTCTDCEEYDLCEECYHSPDFRMHIQRHRFAEVALSVAEAAELTLIAFALASHQDVYCDGCREDLVGVRMRCQVCPYYDLCYDCFQGKWGAEHPSDHAFDQVV